MAKKRKFKEGTIVCRGLTAVLVSGYKGDPEIVGYNCFSGTVVMALPDEEDREFFPVGFYSQTWAEDAFDRTDLDISQIVFKELKLIGVH